MKVSQALQDLKLKYFAIPESSTLLIKFIVENRGFTVVVVVSEKWVDLRVALVMKSRISAMALNEVYVRLLRANARMRVSKFGIDSEGNVGAASDLAIENVTSVTLGTQMRGICALITYFLNEVSGPLKMDCGEPAVSGASTSGVKADLPQTQDGGFEVEISEVTSGSSTRLTVIPHSSVQKILEEAKIKLKLPNEATYLLVHNGRRLGEEHFSETASSLDIRQGESLDVVMIPTHVDGSTQAEQLTQTMRIQDLQSGMSLEVKRPLARPEVKTDSLVLPDGTILSLGGEPFVFGRDNVPKSTFDRLLVSRRHFQVTRDQGLFYIEDRNSTNGTTLNGKEIRGTGKHLLNGGDKVTIAKGFTLLFTKSSD